MDGSKGRTCAPAQVLLALALVVACCGQVLGANEEPTSPFRLLRGARRIVEQGGRFILVQDSPVAPQQPTELGPAGPVQPLGGEGLFERPVFDGAELAAILAGAPAPAEAVTASQMKALPAYDLGQVFIESDSLQTVHIRRRSPLTYHPYIRGYQAGQIYSEADGAWWLSARRDLDSLITKFDTALIQDVVVIPAPYGAR